MAVGEVKFPTRFWHLHSHWLDDYESLLNTYHTNSTNLYNPFSYEKGPGSTWTAASYSFDASTVIAEARTRCKQFDGLVRSMDMIESWRLGVEEAIESAGEVDESVDVVPDLVEDNRVAARKAFLTGKLRQFVGGMAMINAVRTSTFVIERALLEDEYLQTVAEVVVKNYDGVYANRLKLILDAASTISRMNFMRVTINEDIAAVYADMKRVEIMAEWEAIDREMGINLKECLWSFELFQYASNLMSSLHGTVVTKGPKPPKQPVWREVVGGLLVGIGGIGGLLATA